MLSEAGHPSLFVDTFNSLCRELGIRAEATLDAQGYGVILQLSNTPLRTLILDDAIRAWNRNLASEHDMDKIAAPSVALKN